LVLNKLKGIIGLDKTQVFMYGAAPLKQTSRDFFCSIDMPLFNIFGMSETTGATTMHRYNKFSLDSCGAAM
jgi:long-chain-fatty-acid--CoA ligase ACSBG